MRSVRSVCERLLSSKDPAVGGGLPAHALRRDRGDSRSRRVVARTETLRRHVGRSWPAVAIVALLSAGCAAPADSTEATAAAAANLESHGDVTIDALKAKTQACHKASNGSYATDSGGASTISVCKLRNAFFFKADMDIDCDGKKTDACNTHADPSFQSSTAASDSHGNPLDAAKTPYVVVPGVSSRWNFQSAGVSLGSVAAVIYGDKLEFAVVGDIGPKAIIGEASYATAANLGINPNPSTGGVDSGVTYILFPGPSGVLEKNEDHDEAVRVGMQRVSELLSEN
jgi:hypothetical protein